MGNKIPVPKRPPVPVGMTRICVSGFSISHHVGQAQKLAAAIAAEHPDKYETWFYFSNSGFKNFLSQFLQERLPEDQKGLPSVLGSDKTLAEHTSAPFCWLEQGGTAVADGDDKVEGKTYQVKGGRDMLCQWAGKEFPNNESIQALSNVESPPIMNVFRGFDNKTPGGTWMEHK
mmetsp:Transcript_3221/g.3579  ORF Transcript_3221/g.3579 Transcript_3221/m.3579 type:complete len:174 (-) Transcript_3221:241-762(-)